MNLIEIFKEKSELAEENQKIKRGKHAVEKKYSNLLESVDGIQQKYIDLLEEKSKCFDLYVEYQSRCAELTLEKKEQKKQIAQLSELLTAKENEISELTNKLQKLERKSKSKVNETV